MLIDTHCHLTYDELRPQIGAVFARARAAGVTRVITVATTPDDALAALELMREHPEIYLCAGIHPHQAGACSPGDLARLEALHRGAGVSPELARRVVAVGETGLDFHYDFAPRDDQERIFRAQLELASRVGRPVVIHARESEERVCDILRDYPQLNGRVVFHCFSAGTEILARLDDIGPFVSFTGIITFKNAETIRTAARRAAADRIMVETDSPFLSPEPVRKVRPCEPAFVAHTARFLAELRGVRFEEFAAATTANAVRFFNLPEEES
jgi:TatD DNase family protein